MIEQPRDVMVTLAVVESVPMEFTEPVPRHVWRCLGLVCGSWRSRYDGV